MAAISKVFSRSLLVALTFFMALLQLPKEAQSTSTSFLNVTPSSTSIVTALGRISTTTTASTSDDTVTIAQKNTATIEPTPTTAGPQASSSPPSTPTLTCVEFSCTLVQAWNDSFLNTSSGAGKRLKTSLEIALAKLYDDSQYGFVGVVSVEFTGVKSNVRMKAIVQFKPSNEATYLEDVFSNKVKTGKLGSELEVLSDSDEVKPKGVTFGGWTVKSGECKRACSDSETSTGQEFILERTCKAVSNSSVGLKDEMKTTDCAKYCPNGESNAIRVSVMVVVFAAISSFSLQL